MLKNIHSKNTKIFIYKLKKYSTNITISGIPYTIYVYVVVKFPSLSLGISINSFKLVSTWRNISQHKQWSEKVRSHVLSAHAGQKQKLWRDQIKENRSLSPWGWMVPILKMRRFSCLLRLSFRTEMCEMAQIFILEIEWLAVLKCRATGLSTSLFFIRNEGVQQICQLDVGPFHRCKVYNIYYKKCSKLCWRRCM